MKELRSKQALANAKRWHLLKKKLTELSDELSEIKEFFDCEVKEGEAVLCGKFVIGSTQCSRSGLDKEALLKTQGQEFVDKFTKTTWYTKLDIKVAG